MMYIVKTVDNCITDWTGVDKAPVNLNTWNIPYAPETYAQMVCVNGEGLLLKMTCIESDPLTVYTNFFDNVYEDSCMECFFHFERGGKYINCEMNSNGTALIAVGPDRFDRTRIDTFITPPTVKAVKEADKWSVEVYFPLTDIRTVLGDVSLEKGTKFFANFYKCGNKTEIPHFVTWSLIDMPKPDFHQSKYFGELVIE